MEYIKAFVIGGIICVLAQILMDNTKLMPGRVMVLLVCTGVVLGAIGIYEPFLDFAGAGASVPLTGFGYNIWKGMRESIDEFGLLGLFKGGFTAAAVGSSAALIFSYIASLIFSPKMTKN
ncbi:MAG: stage V sporulation protein AE [Lachnospiraceae bacterium]|nr:stage V sporulation protein AE [Lachnospiraceae bacterium]MBQ8166247.1 stage V sporulation protein AE [Lachnospiraceae bacterium]